MSKPTKEDRLKAVHERALRRFDAIQSAVREERLQCLQDRRFYSISGAQWEGGLGEQFENKPRFEMNKVHLAVIRIINEYRNNRITVDFLPKPDGGEASDKLADTCDGLYRADEQDSTAEEAYDNAFEEGVGGGMGAWRLRACYEDEEAEDDDKQRIRLEPIYDADSCVFFDLDAKRQDKSDAKHAFVLTSMSPEAYKETYNDDPESWDKAITQTEFDWSSPDVVYVAEYYEVEQKTEVLRVYRGLALVDGEEPDEVKVWEHELEKDPSRLEVLHATGFRLVRSKKVKKTKVHKYILSGGRVLEDEGHIAGTCIPIVPFYGKRWFIDNIERCMGHVRLAKDAMRLKNMLISMLAEIATLSPIEKPIFTPEQISGHQTMWAEDNVKKYPYLLVNPITDASGNSLPAGAIGYTKAPMIPQALAALLGLTEQDLQDLLGNQQAGEEVQSNVSGKLMELVQTRLDMQSFIYMSNFAKAMKRSGQIWLSMARDVYVEEGRTMKTVGLDDKPGFVQIARPVYDEKTSTTYLENDISEAKFDVTVDVGPTSSSKRAATVRSLTGVLQMVTDPMDQKVISSMIMMNMEGEGMTELRAYYRERLIELGAIKPNEEEEADLAEKQANTPPDPNTTLANALAEEAKAKGIKAQADTMLTAAKTEETQAKTAETLANMQSQERRDVIETMQALQDATAPAPQM